MSDPEERSTGFTEGSITWPLLALAGPLMATQLLQVVYNLTDTFWVGQLGTEPVTALSFSWPMVFLLVSVGGGMTTAGTILVSQHVGAGNGERVTQVAGQTLGFALVIAVASATLGIALTPHLLAVIGSTPGTTVHDLAVTYTRIIFLGMPATVSFYVYLSLLRGCGDTKTPMYLATLSVALNIALDPFVVLGFADNPLFGWLRLEGLEAALFAATGFTGFGVAGAALATVASQGVAATVGLWLLFSGHVSIHLRLTYLWPEVTTIRKIARIGTPGAIDQSTESVAAIVMTALIATVSADAVAAYGIGNRFISLVWLPTVAMGMAVETVVGQNLGNGRPERARHTVYVAIAMLSSAFLLVGALTVVFARPIVGVFVTGAGAEAVVDHGETFLRIVAPTWAVMAVYHMMNGAFYGSGSTRMAMGIGVTTLWGARAVFAGVFILVLGFGATGAWYAIALSNVTAALVGALFFVRGRWLEHVLDPKEGPAGAERAVSESSGERG